MKNSEVQEYLANYSGTLTAIVDVDGTHYDVTGVEAASPPDGLVRIVVNPTARDD